MRWLKESIRCNLLILLDCVSRSGSSWQIVAVIVIKIDPISAHCARSGGAFRLYERAGLGRLLEIEVILRGTAVPETIESQIESNNWQLLFRASQKGFPPSARTFLPVKMGSYECDGFECPIDVLTPDEVVEMLQCFQEVVKESWSAFCSSLRKTDSAVKRSSILTQQAGRH